MNKRKKYLIYNLTMFFLHYPHVVYEKQKQAENWNSLKKPVKLYVKQNTYIARIYPV